MQDVPPDHLGRAPGSLEVLDVGALVVGWSPPGQAPVLFRHPEVHRPVAPHAGIPVCWPWFGDGPTPDAPSHGIARTATWRRADGDGGPGSTRRCLVLTDADATSTVWPHPYTLRLDVEASDRTLTVTLTTTTTGSEPVVVGEALHAYLAVGDVREARVRGLDGAAFFDKTTGERRTQEGDLVLVGETDRVYRSDAVVTVEDPVLGRRLRVETEGAANRVVWNPWDDEAARVDDIADAWPRFVCVEAANALDDVVTVAPGTPHSLMYRLTVEDL